MCQETKILNKLKKTNYKWTHSQQKNLRQNITQKVSHFQQKIPLFTMIIKKKTFAKETSNHSPIPFENNE